MPRSPATARLFFLLLLFTGTLCSSMIVPFIGFFLVEGLGQAPWMISLYSLGAVGITLFTNRQFARQIDRGAPAFRLIALAACAYICASAALLALPTVWVVLSVGVLGFGLSASAVSTMFSLGGALAAAQDIDRPRFNAYMRATTSTAWMIGPAATYLIADAVALRAVFAMALAGGVLWITLLQIALPRDIAAPAPAKADTSVDTGPIKSPLFLAAAFIFCLSLAHSLTFSALPLFYVHEVGLPGYAPGVAFSIKTFVEVFAIFSTPLLIARIGLYRALFGTAVLAVTAIFILSTVTSLPQMLAGAALEGLYYGLYASLGISYIQSFAANRPAQATALYWNTLMVTGLLAGPVVGAVASAYDFQTVIQLAAVVAMVAVGVLLLGHKRPSPTPSAPLR
jgi:SET family sugar efflux transporter-like MFS transporter